MSLLAVVSGEEVVVMSGEEVFTLIDTKGMPLDLVVETATENGAAIDVAGLIRCMLNAGWKQKTIESKFESIMDITSKPVWAVREGV